MNNHTGIYIKLHQENDKEILKKLQNLNNKQGYIKEVVLNDSVVYKKYEKGVGNGQYYHDHIEGQNNARGSSSD